MTDWNVIGRRDRAGRLMPCGVIDFGDVTRTLRVCELAVAASIAYGHEPDDPICAAAEIVRGFDAACPLDDAELEALPHLIAARAAIVAVGTEQQAVLEPHNDYAQRVRAGDWAICETAAGAARRARRGGLPAGLRAQRGRARRRACPPGRLAAPGRRRPAPTPTSRRPALDPASRRAGAIGAHGEARLHATRELSNAEPATIHLGLDVFAPEGSEVRAPLAGRVERAGERRARARGRRARRAPGRARARGGGRRRASRRATSSGTSRAGGALPPHLHVQVAPAGLAALPGPRDAGARRRRGSRSARIPGRCSGSPAAERPERAARAPPRRDPAGAAALLRRAARDRARPAPAPLRRARPRLPRLRQQRRRRRPQPSARDRRRRRASCACSTRTRASSTRA